MFRFSNDPDIADQQVQAIIFYLVTFGYIDGEFDVSERVFVTDYIHKLVEWRVASLTFLDELQKTECVLATTLDFVNYYRKIDGWLNELFQETVSWDEEIPQFVLSKLKLRCFEIFQLLEGEMQQQLLADVDELIIVDGVIHPAETQFRNELLQLLKTENPFSEMSISPMDQQVLKISKPVQILPPKHDHPFFPPMEFHFSNTEEILSRQTLSDYELIRGTLQTWTQQRRQGAGRLNHCQTVADLEGAEPFLDGFIHVLMPEPGRVYELIVLGDLHGCYSCLKAALMQSDFIRKVEAFRDDPDRNPDIKLVLLGDYIDRGFYSFNGILRVALQLLLTWPDHVYILRGNHEFYLEKEGQIVSAVVPADALKTMAPHFSQDHLMAYQQLFDAMPTSLLFGQTIFTHGGIPTDDLIEEKWRDLSSLNGFEFRLQMMWSDPSAVDYVPSQLQQSTARFGFGSTQFRRFMALLGTHTMIRGHQSLCSGFEEVYHCHGVRLLSLFSAGGQHNNDLPRTSSYRKITPMALSLTYRDGILRAMPFSIAYEAYQDCTNNQFHRFAPEISLTC